MKTILLTLILFLSSNVNAAILTLTNDIDNADTFTVNLGSLYLSGTTSYAEVNAFNISSATENINYISFVNVFDNTYESDYISLYKPDFTRVFNTVNQFELTGVDFLNFAWMQGFQFERLDSQQLGTGEFYTVTAYTPTPGSGNVPEPGVLALLALGLLSLAFSLNYRKKMI